MTTLAVILGGIGGILILVGLVGGGFTISGNVMPRVGKAVRLPCFIVGAVLVFVAVGVGFANPGPGPGPRNGTIETTGTGAYIYQAPSLGAAKVGQLANGVAVQIECTAQGEVVVSNGQSSSLWDRTSDGYIPDVNVYTGTNQPTMPNC